MCLVADEILHGADCEDVALLVVGDPLGLVECCTCMYACVFVCLVCVCV